MDKKLIIAASIKYLLGDQHCRKMLDQKQLIPIGSQIGFISPNTQINIKYRGKQEQIQHIEEGCSIEPIKGAYYLKLPSKIFKELQEHFIGNTFLIIVIEGSSDQVSLIVSYEKDKNNIFNLLEQTAPSIRLVSFDLPPSTFTVIDAPTVKWKIYTALALRDKELFSYRTESFIKTPHVLTYLFSHVMSLESKDHINYISVLRVVADTLRKLLSPRIRRLTKNHNKLWSQFYGEKVSFLDGGMSRIVSLPGTEPTGIRVGVYSVIPGEVDLDKREEWQLFSYVIGDVIGDKSVIDDEDYRTDIKRLQEAARYIIEPLIALRFIERCKEKPKVLFLHGPLQNKFEIYDELSPNYIPAVSIKFLKESGITKEKVQHLVSNIHTNARGKILWNSCIPIYCYIMMRLFKADLPIVGVIERAPSARLIKQVLNLLVADKKITVSAKNKLLDKIQKYEFFDELLFGCILDEGEYIDPIPLPKNFRKDAHDRWVLTIDEFPIPVATMLKCSVSNFPYRIEFNRINSSAEVEKVMNLLFHMSMLLPQYAFPVGLDIVDKYAKIPDWISKGISESLTANIIRKVMEEGDDRVLMQVRRLLSLSPRDFFFRPKAEGDTI